jgi:hypothetical protein
MLWDQMHGNGSDVVWHGEDSNGWGVVQDSESATATLFLTIDEAITNSIVLLYEITGDIYGSTPHILTDVLILTNNGTNDTWLTLGNPSGNLTLGETESLLLNFNTFGIPIGTYHCNISVESQLDSTGIEVTLYVTEATQIKEIRDVLRVYPNPNFGEMSVELPFEGRSHIEVFDVFGHCIFDDIWENRNNRISFKYPVPSVYLIVITHNNTRYLQKITVAH